MEREPRYHSEIRRSRQLADASRQLVKNTRAHIDNTRQRLDRARNILQLCWLLRTLRERRRQRGSR